MKPFFLYMLRCSDGSFYVGQTDDMDRRLAEHQDGTFRGYTSERRPVELVWLDEFPTRDAALTRERQLKGWSRAKKEALVRGDWNTLNRLSRGPDRRERAGASSASGPSTPRGPRGPRYARDER